MLTDLDLLHLRSIMQQQVECNKKDLENFKEWISEYKEDEEEVINLKDLEKSKKHCEAYLKTNTEILQKIERVLQIKNYDLEG